MRGVSVDRKQAKVTLDDVPDRSGVAGRVFSAVAGSGISVDMIVQSIGPNQTTDLSFTIHEADMDQTCTILEPIARELGSGIIAKGGVAKLSVVGIGMRSHAGVAAKFFEALGRGGINIELISTSEIKIAVVVANKDIDNAARLTHESFGLARLTPIAVS